jgi:hypothetical protein
MCFISLWAIANCYFPQKAHLTLDFYFISRFTKPIQLSKSERNNCSVALHISKPAFKKQHPSFPLGSLHNGAVGKPFGFL